VDPAAEAAIAEVGVRTHLEAASQAGAEAAFLVVVAELPAETAVATVVVREMGEATEVLTIQSIQLAVTKAARTPNPVKAREALARAKAPARHDTDRAADLRDIRPIPETLDLATKVADTLPDELPAAVREADILQAAMPDPTAEDIRARVQARARSEGTPHQDLKADLSADMQTCREADKLPTAVTITEMAPVRLATLKRDSARPIMA